MMHVSGMAQRRWRDSVTLERKPVISSPLDLRPPAFSPFQCSLLLKWRRLRPGARLQPSTNAEHVASLPWQTGYPPDAVSPNPPPSPLQDFDCCAHFRAAGPQTGTAYRLGTNAGHGTLVGVRKSRLLLSLQWPSRVDS